MHEFGVTENIVKIASDKATEAQASKITKINLVVGELSGFVPDCIQFYFDFLSKDTVAELNFVAEIAPLFSIQKTASGIALSAIARVWR